MGRSKRSRQWRLRKAAGESVERLSGTNVAFSEAGLRRRDPQNIQLTIGGKIFTQLENVRMLSTDYADLETRVVATLIPPNEEKDLAADAAARLDGSHFIAGYDWASETIGQRPLRMNEEKFRQFNERRLDGRRKR